MARATRVGTPLCDVVTPKEDDGDDGDEESLSCAITSAYRAQTKHGRTYVHVCVYSKIQISIILKQI